MIEYPHSLSRIPTVEELVQLHKWLLEEEMRLRDKWLQSLRDRTDENGYITLTAEDLGH